MGPAPMRRHQTISMNLIRILTGAIPHESPCKVYHAPFDVRLPEGSEADNDITTVVQPDLVVVCDSSKLDDRGCRGAPDLIIEILSPSSAARDINMKRALYERHGVREYWIVQPGEHIALVFVLRNGAYDAGAVYTEGDEPALDILPRLHIPLLAVFAD
jgi:Uma2 family endonuclease